MYSEHRNEICCPTERCKFLDWQNNSCGYSMADYFTILLGAKISLDLS
jgi:hypothetical protein